MKRIRHSRCWAILGLALALLTGVAGSVQAADIRFGYIDSARIFREFKDAQEAQARFDRQVQAWQSEATEKEKAVKQLRDEVRDQSPVLSSVKRQEKEEALQKAISDYERFIQDIWGPQGKAAQQNEEATREVVRLIRTVVEKVAEGKGLNFVVDAAGGFIIYADRSLDLTPEVLGELNSGTAGSAR